MIEKIEQRLRRNQNPEAKFQTDGEEFEGGSNNQFAFLVILLEPEEGSICHFFS